MKICTSIKDNQNQLKQVLTSEDITFLDVKINNTDAVLVFVNDLIDKESVGELILRPADVYDGTVDEQSLFKLFLSPEKKIVNTYKEVVTDVLLGNAVLIADGIDKAFSFGLKHFEKRAITEPPTSTVIKGPREGFVESLPVNISMMRRKLKTPDLIFENVTIGKYSETPVALCYIKGIADIRLVKKLKKRLQRIDIDDVLDSSYVSKFLREHKYSLFKQIHT